MAVPWSSAPAGHADCVDAVLALTRRGAAHDVNNLLTVIRGNLQLMQLLGTAEIPALVAEIELACARLALLGDEWLLAGERSSGGIGSDGEASGVADGLREIVDLIGRSLQVEMRCRIDVRAERSRCGLSDRTLRALLHCALRVLARAQVGAPLRVRLVAYANSAVVLLRAPCGPATHLRLDSPATLARQPGVQRIDPGLWDVAQLLHGRGGDFALGRSARRVWLRLTLPPAALPGATPDRGRQ
jgi:hypothetical protein